MRQRQKRLQPGLLLATKQLDLGPAVGTADNGQGRNQENVLQGMQSGLGPTGIIDFGEQGNQGHGGGVGHGRLRDGMKHPILPRADTTQFRMRLPWGDRAAGNETATIL